MTKNRAANDRQVCIRAYKIVGKLLHKIEELNKGGLVYSHRCMLSIENDAMLVIVNVRRILEAPIAIVNGNGNDTVILSGREVDSAGITLTLLAKKALTRNFDERNPNPFWADMENELLEKINALGIGPQGLGGKTTALCVNIEQFPAHIASLPVAVNINCHVARHETEVI